MKRSTFWMCVGIGLAIKVSIAHPGTDNQRLALYFIAGWICFFALCGKHPLIMGALIVQHIFRGGALIIGLLGASVYFIYEVITKVA